MKCNLNSLLMTTFVHMIHVEAAKRERTCIKLNKISDFFISKQKSHICDVELRGDVSVNWQERYVNGLINHHRRSQIKRGLQTLHFSLEGNSLCLNEHVSALSELRLTYD